MRSIICILFGLLIGQSFLFAGDDYYWSENRKIAINEDRTSMVLIYKDQRGLEKDYYEQKAAISEAVVSPDLKTALLRFPGTQLHSSKEVVQNLGIDINDLEWHSFGYKYNNGSPLRATNRISFQLKDGFNRSHLKKLIANKAVFDRSNYGTLMLKALGRNINVVVLANEIYESGFVEYCHPDFIAEIVKHEDPLYPQQYYLNNTGQFQGLIDIDIDASQAWDISKGSDQIIVAVIDDGVEAHDDLEDASYNSRILSGCTPGKTGGGTGIPQYSYDGHGEAVTGILTASHNNINVRGVAPNVKILPVNIFWTGTTDQEVADGINWAWQNGADVLNNSWGYLCGPDVYHDVVKVSIDDARTLGRNGKGSVVVFAAGNNNPTDRYGYGPAGYISFPASVTGVVCVSATDRNGNISGYSSFGNRIDLTALGGAATGIQKMKQKQISEPLIEWAPMAIIRATICPILTALQRHVHRFQQLRR